MPAVDAYSKLADEEIKRMGELGSFSMSGKPQRPPPKTASATPTSDSLPLIAIFYMLLLSVQFAVQPVLTAQFTSATSNKTLLVMLQELFKSLLAGTMLYLTSPTDAVLVKTLSVWSFKSWLTVAGVPAALYAVQNKLALQAYQNLDSVAFNTLNQTKTLSAAIFCWVFLGKRQTPLQCVALVILLLATLVIEGVIDSQTLLTNPNILAVAYDGVMSKLATQSDRVVTGIIPCLIASLISGFAGALSQKFMTGSEGRNAYMYSMELSLFSFLALALSLPFTADGANLAAGVRDLRLPNLLPIMTNACGGIIVGQVTKHAGSVRKGFALILGIVFTGALQAALGGGGLSDNQKVGGALVVASMYLHMKFGEKRGEAQKKKAVQQKRNEVEVTMGKTLKKKEAKKER